MVLTDVQQQNRMLQIEKWMSAGHNWYNTVLQKKMYLFLMALTISKHMQ